MTEVSVEQRLEVELRRGLEEMADIGASALSGILPVDEIQAFMSDEFTRFSLPTVPSAPVSVSRLTVHQSLPTVAYITSYMNAAFDDPRATHEFELRLRDTRTEHMHGDRADREHRNPGVRLLYHLDGPVGTIHFRPTEGQPGQDITYGMGDGAVIAQSPANPLRFIRDGVVQRRLHPIHAGKADAPRIILAHDIFSPYPLNLDKLRRR